MAVDASLISQVFADQVLKIPVKGQDPEDFVIPLKFKFLEAGGRYIFSRLQIFYTIATGGAASGSSTVVVAETIDSKTPPRASIFLFDGTSFDEYTYSSLNVSTRTFTLDSTAHPSGLTKAYADGNEAKLESEATVDIDCRDATFEYTPGGANNQIIIQAEGSEVNLTIPASLPSSDYSQITDTTEIYFQTNEGAFFTPADLPGTTVEWRADALAWNEASGIWTSVDGGWRWARRNGTGTSGTFGAVSEITINSNTWWQLEKLQPDGTTWTVTPFNDGSSGLGFVTFAMEVNDVGNGGLLGGVSNTGQGIRINDSQAIEFDNHGDTTGAIRGFFNFNGVYSGGSIIEDPAEAFYNHVALTDVPLNTAFVASGFAFVQLSNTDHYQILNNSDDASFRRLNAAKYYGMVMGTDALTLPSDKEKLVRYMGFIAGDRGHVNPISSTLPDYNVRPLGGTSAVLDLAVPATSVTFSNIPETGTDLYIYDAADNNELASLTSTLATHELAYSANGSEIRVQIVFPAGTFLEINLTLAVGNIPIDVGAIAIDERNFLNPS